MAKSKETFNKKDKQQRRLKNRQDKEQKKEQRRANAKKGKSLEEMMAYVDENGIISDTPPDPRNKIVVNAEDIQIGIPAGNERVFTRSGFIHFFNEEKGFGFIMDSISRQKIFFHHSSLSEPVKQSDKVTFMTELSNRGMVAVNVKKVGG
ncbi:MAG: cold-shock protein [Chitinophagales bacterium]